MKFNNTISAGILAFVSLAASFSAAGPANALGGNAQVSNGAGHYVKPVGVAPVKNPANVAEDEQIKKPGPQIVASDVSKQCFLGLERLQTATKKAKVDGEIDAREAYNLKMMRHQLEGKNCLTM